jgi:hypothetical protein
LTGSPGGRSGSFVYTTHDNRFVIKTISASEKLTLLNRLLPSYIAQVFSGDSALAKILGVFQVQCVGNYCTNIVLMENVSLPKSEIFDLKGSSFHRESESKVGLDINFSLEIGSLELDSEDAQRLLRRVFQDSRMLASCNIMDYSLLVTVTYGELPPNLKSQHIYRSSKKGQSYLIAVIDILQEYNFSKKVETFWKHKVKRVPLESLSSVEPKHYSARFIEFLSKIL